MARSEKLSENLPVLGLLLQRVWPRMRKQRGIIAASLSVLVAEVFLRLLQPWPVSFLVDHVLAPTAESARAPGASLRSLPPETLIIGAAVAMLAVAGLRALSRYISAVGFALVGTRVMTEVRHELYRHVQGLSLSFHSKSRAGDLIIRVIGDVGMMREVAVTAVLPMVGNLLILTGMVSVMLWLHWQLALAALATGPLFWITTLRLGRKIRVVARKQRKVEGQLATTAAEAIGAIQTVQALSLDEAFSESFGSQGARDLSQGVKGKRLIARLERTAEVLSVLAQAFVLLLGARAVLARELSVGELLVFMTYVRGGFRPIRNFTKYSGRLARASAAAERVLEVFDIEPEVQDLPGAVEAQIPSGAVCFENVSYGYEPGHHVLSKTNFEVEAGTRVALVGPSGSGKSTILSLCLRLHDPEAGRVLIDGHDIREFTVASLRSQISVSLQDPVLFAMTVRENIGLGGQNVTQAAIEAAAELANADSVVRALPEGYETIVGERGVSLSRGQRQRIALARCAVRQAPIVLLDEPFTGLDEESRRAVSLGFERLAQGRTTLLVTHELADAVSCDLILFLERGRIVERGTHGELMRHSGRYASMFRAQQTGTTGQGPQRATA